MPFCLVIYLSCKLQKVVQFLVHPVGLMSVMIQGFKSIYTMLLLVVHSEWYVITSPMSADVKLSYLAPLLISCV